MVLSVATAREVPNESQSDMEESLRHGAGGHRKTRVAQGERMDLQIEVKRASRETVSDSVLEEKSHKGGRRSQSLVAGTLEKAHGSGRGHWELG